MRWPLCGSAITPALAIWIFERCLLDEALLRTFPPQVSAARRVSDEMSRWGAEVTQANGGAVLSQADTEQLMAMGCSGR